METSHITIILETRKMQNDFTWTNTENIKRK
jgi:hypothetical protein